MLQMSSGSFQNCSTICPGSARGCREVAKTDSMLQRDLESEFWQAPHFEMPSETVGLLF